MSKNMSIHIKSVILLLTIFSKDLCALQMSCNNENFPTDVIKGDPFDFHCTSTQNFHSCVLERTGKDRKSNYCNFTMYSSSFFGAASQEELQRVGWDCKLDNKEPYRIKIIENVNQRKCHLRIKSLELIGKYDY